MLTYLVVLKKIKVTEFIFFSSGVFFPRGSTSLEGINERGSGGEINSSIEKAHC
jgi:hypothetical protein